MINPLAAAKVICETRDWSISNLELQKLLYLAHMFYIGLSQNNAPLLSGNFEAWDYGPVHPNVYHTTKVFGDLPVKNVFHEFEVGENSPAIDLLKKTATELSGRTPGNLVAITHWEKGAWSRNYQAGRKGIKIPNSHILEEYNERVRQRAA